PAMEGTTMSRDSSLRALADLPQVTVKVTSHNLAPLGGAGGARAFVEQLAGWFGPGRMLWGSDYPQSAHESYTGLVDLAIEAIADLDPTEAAAVVGGNCERLFGFAADPTAHSYE
ncbi:MAG TPA: amidohydrolase family protein, partial [Acidimicrobiales bacterium]|nr:amidohydrolase family protein [Acidimicrobiales bacterium]